MIKNRPEMDQKMDKNTVKNTVDAYLNSGKLKMDFKL